MKFLVEVDLHSPSREEYILNLVHQAVVDVLDFRDAKLGAIMRKKPGFGVSVRRVRLKGEVK